MTNQAVIEQAKEHFGKIVEEQLARVERLKNEPDWTDFTQIRPIVVGVCGGDGIGPYITTEAQRVLETLLKDEIRSGKFEFRTIEGLTIENRVAVMKAIPDDVLVELKKCHVIIKGPTTTPQQGDPWPNIESANVAMRRELDLFANVRPVRVPELGIDWMFFRENTEGAYILGSRGIRLTPDVGFDFVVTTLQGSVRILRAAFDYARKMGGKKVTVVAKYNIIKVTDGMFLEIAREVAKDYPEIPWEDWIVDVFTAKLIDPKRQRDFQVIALPNLYGDIVTDEAAELQGGVGTAGSANIGKTSAMFEAIHGSAPRMVNEGRAIYADPSSVIRCGAMMLDHIGYTDLGSRLSMALEMCGQYEKRLVMTGRDTGAKGSDFADYVIEWVNNPNLEGAWKEASAARMKA